MLRYDGTWLTLVPMEMKWFHDVKLPISSNDEKVWQFCQERSYLLLTGNRTNDDKERSLEFAIRKLLTPDSLPVITIGNLQRVLPDLQYRKRCAERPAEIAYDLEDYRGTMRIFIP